jgi:hypothetical protein
MYGCTIYIHTCPETFQERKQGGGEIIHSYLLVTHRHYHYSTVQYHSKDLFPRVTVSTVCTYVYHPPMISIVLIANAAVFLCEWMDTLPYRS